MFVLPMLPTPIQPTVIFSLGATAPSAPNADAGIMCGSTATAPAALRHKN